MISNIEIISNLQIQNINNKMLKIILVCTPHHKKIKMNPIVAPNIRKDIKTYNLLYYVYMIMI